MIGYSGNMAEPDQNTPKFDLLLRLDPASEAAFEAEHGAARGKHLRAMILVGLVFYNLFNLSAYLLMTDIFWLSVVLRLGLVTLGSLVLAYYVTRVPAVWRERLVLGGMLNACVLPLFLFTYSAHPWSGYSYLELPLSLFFASAMLRLRFTHILILSAAIYSVAVVALAIKTGLPRELKFALGLQLATAMTFVVTSGYLIEKQRITGFLQTLMARNEAEKRGLESRHHARLSLTDPLTGVPNRRRFDETLQAFQDAADRFGLIMIDVDFFKQFNDTLGHQSGDLCLQRIALALQRVATGHDGHIARIGGEEFAVLSRCDTRDHLQSLCEDYQSGVSSLKIAHPDRPDKTGYVTISAGAVLVQPEAGWTRRRIMTIADAGLYQSKKDGRNRFTVLSDAA